MATEQEKTGWAKHGMPDKAKRLMPTVRDGVAALWEAVAERIEACESRLYATQEEIDAPTILQQHARSIARRIGQFSDSSTALDGELSSFGNFFNLLRGQFGSHDGKGEDDPPLLYDFGHSVEWEKRFQYDSEDPPSDISDEFQLWREYIPVQLLEHADGGFGNWLVYNKYEIDEAEAEKTDQSESGEQARQTLLAKRLAPIPRIDWLRQRFDALNRMTTRVTNGANFFWLSSSGEERKEEIAVQGDDGYEYPPLVRTMNVQSWELNDCSPGYYHVASNEHGAPVWSSALLGQQIDTGWKNCCDGRAAPCVFVVVSEVDHDNPFGEFPPDYPLRLFPYASESSCRWKLVFPRNLYRKAGVKIKAYIQICGFQDANRNRITWNGKKYLNWRGMPDQGGFDPLGTSYSIGDVIVAEAVSPGAKPKKKEDGIFVENEEEVVLFEMEPFQTKDVPAGFSDEHENTPGLIRFGFCLRVLWVEEDWSDVFEYVDDSGEEDQENQQSTEGRMYDDGSNDFLRRRRTTPAD